MRFRQIHLDFHTSEHIPDVGARFDEEQFQEMLQLGHVDSVTLFSKCHHGLSYHETKVGVRHPHLKTELLARQIAACKKIDVRTPIYLSAGIDEAALQRHPEWAFKDKNGVTWEPLQPGFKAICFNTPYLDYFCAQIEEVVEMFDGGDGFFLDIVVPRHCYCPYCLDGMAAANLDPQCQTDVDKFAQMVLEKYYARTTAACRVKDANKPVFHNGGHIPKGATEVLRWQSHLELESLPTGGWGYDHFPISAKYAATTGMPYLGMTGKFHTTWGEFGGFKRPEALRYECAAMLAFGARCSVGDQLHPSGAVNRSTYNLIGSAYEEVEAKESFILGATPVSEIALVSPEALQHSESTSTADRDHTSQAEEGAARMLLEMHAQFDVVDLDRDLSTYKLVILPDEIPLSGTYAEKIKKYLAGGGKVLASGHSGLDPQGTTFILDENVEVIGRSEWNPDYLIATELTPNLPVRDPFVIHGGAWDVRPRDAGTYVVLAQRSAPYFNRAWNHFCSHRHTPDATTSEFAGVIGNRNWVYFAHSIFSRYRIYGQPLYRDLVSDAIEYLIGEPALQVHLPSTARAALTRQQAQRRYVLHVLYATPVLRGQHEGMIGGAPAIEVIEDLVPLHDVKCSLQIGETISAIHLAPSGQSIDWSRDENGAVTFTVPHLLCHQMVELQYAG